MTEKYSYKGTGAWQIRVLFSDEELGSEVKELELRKVSEMLASNLRSPRIDTLFRSERILSSL